MADNENKKSDFNPAGLGIGLAIGAALGVALDNISIGLSLGVAIGVAISLAMGQRGEEKARGGDKPSDDSDS